MDFAFYWVPLREKILRRNQSVDMTAPLPQAAQRIRGEFK